MKIKKLLLLLLILGTCIINSGCMITQEDYLCAAEKYMEKKYGEEFEGKYFYDVNYDSMYPRFSKRMTIKQLSAA